MSCACCGDPAARTGSRLCLKPRPWGTDALLPARLFHARDEEAIFLSLLALCWRWLLGCEHKGTWS